MSRALVFIDTETTGLDSIRHEVVEVAWAIGDGDVSTLVLPHAFTTPDPVALSLNGYLDRRLFDRATWADHDAWFDLHDRLENATLVGANPAFDARFLSAFFAAQLPDREPDPWHHRLLDVQAYGMAALALDEMPGLADLVRLCRERGHDVPESDHTAAADVEATRATFRALRAEVST